MLDLVKRIVINVTISVFSFFSHRDAKNDYKISCFLGMIEGVTKEDDLFNENEKMDGNLCHFQSIVDPIAGFCCGFCCES